MAAAKSFLSLTTGQAIAVAMLFMDTASANAEDPSDALPLDDKSPGTISALGYMRTKLADVHPGKKGSPHALETKDGIYILYGDLFHTGHSYALLDLTGDGESEAGLGFAEWSNGAWNPRGLWRIQPIWRPKGWKSSEGDHLPISPAKKPFWLKNLGGDSRPIVIVAGEVEKYYQEHYLFRFDSKTHRLEKIAEAMEEPEYVDGWIRLSTNSGRRAIWQEWAYLRWQGDKRVQKASWHDEVPYNNPDDSFILVTRNDGQGVEQKFRVTDEGSGFEIKRNDLPFAHCVIKSRASAAKSPPGAPNEEYYAALAYLFEKLTGLPRKLYPVQQGAKPPGRLEKMATLQVTGHPDAVRMLSPKP